MTRFFFDVMSRSGPMEEIPKEDIAKLFVRHGTVQSVELLDRWMKLTQNIRYFYRVTLETEKDPFVIRSMLNGKDMNNCYIRVHTCVDSAENEGAATQKISYFSLPP